MSLENAILLFETFKKITDIDDNDYVAEAMRFAVNLELDSLKKILATVIEEEAKDEQLLKSKGE
jgi:transcription initiation factor TFIIIB Brf1 subunit/transcription initiation factor TFIIB